MSHLREDPPPSTPAIRRPVPRRRQVSADELVAGIASGDRSSLARAITLVESTNEQHQLRAREVLSRVMERTGDGRNARTVRVGITGVPGVGKSTLIDQLGVNLTAGGHRVAVLAVDPSSGVTGGSILGDKTRMARLSVDAGAFIRPSPSAGTLGGVASKTRETMLLCEAAGYDVVLIETVGVGQSETVVADMTDVFCCLMLPGAGDELQGIKRGLLELADVIAVNKCEADNERRASAAVREYVTALHYTRGSDGQRSAAPVIAVSGRDNIRLDELWRLIEGQVRDHAQSGELSRRRREQAVRWMWSIVDERLRHLLRHHPEVSGVLHEVEGLVRSGELPATGAADRLLGAFLGGKTV